MAYELFRRWLCSWSRKLVAQYLREYFKFSIWFTKIENEIAENWSDWYCSMYVLMMRDRIVFRSAKRFIRTSLACRIYESHHSPKPSRIEIYFKRDKFQKICIIFVVTDSMFWMLLMCFHDDSMFVLGFSCLFLWNWRRQDISLVLGDIVKRDMGIVSERLYSSQDELQ